MHLVIPACNHQLTSNLSIFGHHSKTNPTKETEPGKRSTKLPKQCNPVEFSKEGKEATQPPPDVNSTPIIFPSSSPFHSFTNHSNYTVTVCLPTTGVHAFTQTATCNYTSGAHNTKQQQLPTARAEQQYNTRISNTMIT